VIDPRLQNRIVRDPAICGGEPIVRGTRVTLRVIIASLAEGDSPEEIVAAFPSLCVEDVRADIAFATALWDVASLQSQRLMRAS
jgi:uncharacterized protein (DUF433 family)